MKENERAIIVIIKVDETGECSRDCDGIIKCDTRYCCIHYKNNHPAYQVLGWDKEDLHRESKCKASELPLDVEMVANLLEHETDVSEEFSDPDLIRALKQLKQIISEEPKE